MNSLVMTGPHEAQYTKTRVVRAVNLLAIINYLIEIYGHIDVFDDGGRVLYWIHCGILPSSKISIHVCNINLEESDLGDSRFQTSIADATNLCQFKDNEFTLVVCNSVIAHVGSYESQVKMTNEIRRVGMYYSVQTPNPSFPVDWITRAPFFHYLPIDVRARIMSLIRVGKQPKISDFKTAKKWLTDKELPVNLRLFKSLFPNSHVIGEYVYRFPVAKSYTLVSDELSHLEFK